MEKERAMKNKALLVTGIVLALVTSGFIYYYVQSSSTISANTNNISSLKVANDNNISGATATISVVYYY